MYVILAACCFVLFILLMQCWNSGRTDGFYNMGAHPVVMVRKNMPYYDYFDHFGDTASNMHEYMNWQLRSGIYAR